MANYNKSFTLSTAGSTTTQNTIVGDTITCTINSNGNAWTTTVSNCTVSPSSGTNGSSVITTGSSGNFSVNFNYTINKQSYFHVVSGTATLDNTPENFVSGGWVGAASLLNTYYYASFQSGVTGSSSTVGTYTVGSVSPGTSISLALVSGYTATASAYSINGAAWRTASSTVSNGDVIRWRLLSSSNASTTARYKLTIGTVGRTFSVATAAPSFTAPVISSVTNDNAASSSVTTTVNLSSNGSGGSLQYAQTTSNSVPSSGWQTSNQFSHPRGTTRYYWASQSTNTSGAYSSSVSHTVGYLAADTAVAPTPTSQTIANGATSASVTVGSVARSTEGVAVRVNNGSTNLATATGNNQTLTWTSSLPTAGNTTTYEIFTRRATSTGGDGSTWTATNDTFTVTRSQPNATLDLNIGISNYSGPTRYYGNGNTVAASSTVVWMNYQTAYTHELTGCGADTIYYASYTSGASQGSTTAYSNLSPIGRTWTTASTRSLNGMSGSTAGINGPTYSTGDIVYIWAVLNPNSQGGSTIGNSTTMTYTGSSYYVERPDTLVTVTPSTTTVGYVSGHPGGTGDTSSPTVNVTSDSSGTQYRLYTTNINRWVSTYNGGGSSTTDFTISYDEASSGQAGTGFTELPSNGNSFTYTTQCRVTSGTPDPVNGGGAAWVEVGNSGEPFSITRSNSDTQPDAFDLGSNLTNVSTGTPATSATITIAGLTAGVSTSFSFTNNSHTKVSKNGGTFSTSGGTVVNGDTLQVEITASSSNSVTLSTTLSVGSPARTDSWSVTSAASGTGSSGGGGGAVTGGTFGLAIYRATGSNPPVVLDQSVRTNNIIVSGSKSVGGNGSEIITCPGMTLTNTSEIGVIVKNIFASSLFTIQRGTGQFTINNNTSGALTARYVAFRWG